MEWQLYAEKIAAAKGLALMATDPAGARASFQQALGHAHSALKREPASAKALRAEAPIC